MTALLLALAAPAPAASVVKESARDIPVAYNVDVVVVGGTTAGVAAAEAAAKAGARVFLAAREPYLGVDVTGTLRLWLEDGETPQSPLAKRLYAGEGRAPQAPTTGERLRFSYKADQPSNAKHPDTKRPSRLADGQWGRPEDQSVQYNEDVTLTVDLGEPREVGRVTLIGYQRPKLEPFHVASVAVARSNDGKTWQEVGVVKTQDPEEPLVTLSADVDDTTRFLRLAVEGGEQATRILLGEILVTKPKPDEEPEKKEPRRSVVRPLHVKKVLDQTLLDAGVTFLYGCFATDVLRDGDGKPCGIVMANRSGRQAVVAKTIVDATSRAWVARMAGAAFRPYPAGQQRFQRVVIGGEPREGEGIAGCENAAAPLLSAAGRRARSPGPYRVLRYTLELPMKDGSFASLARAEQVARDKTYHPDQQLASDVLFQVPPDSVKAEAREDGEWAGAEGLDLACCRPAGVPGLYVLGGCIDVPRERAAKLLRPLAYMALGARVGEAAVKEAKSASKPQGVHLPGGKVADAVVGEVNEVLVGVRPTQELPTVPQKERPLPVLDRYDVVVIGGGTGGAPAGIGAARQGAKVLVVEYLHGLGGVGTLGLITKYYWGNRVGFTKSVPGGGSWHPEKKMEWWRSELRKAGADIWFGAIGCGALVDGNRVMGAVVATPQRRGIILADVVVDSTGNADIAAAAGAMCVTTDGTDIAVQGTGLPPRRLGATYTNTDFTIADPTDMVDVWHLRVYAKQKYGRAFDAGQLVDTRERRRIVGDYAISPLDQINGRTFLDTIAISRSNFDSHGYTVHPAFSLRFPDKKGVRCHMPYRAFLPRGLDGILVTGLAVSAHRDSVPVIRMQPDIQNHGYAIGVAGSMIAEADCPTRSLDIKALQQHLVEVGNLPKSVLTDEDSYPLPDDAIAKAVKTIPDGYKGVAVVLAQPERSLPLLKEAYAKASGQAKLAYAHTLAMMGDDTGAEQLVAAVNARDGWDKGWNYVGMGQFGASLSRLDSYILALGRAGDRRGVPAIIAKARQLTPKTDFSHHRAVARALMMLSDPRAAEPLDTVLRQEGIRGKAIPSVQTAKERDAKSRGGTNAVRTRRESLRELFLAAALYRCGDHEGLGETILKEYTGDLRGHFARFAAGVLEAGKE
jgi:hypothetical protein